MQTETIFLGGLVAVTVLIILFSTRLRAQGPRGPQGQFSPDQGQGPWPQQPGPNQPSQQPSNYPGNRRGSNSGAQSRGGSWLQFFAIIGVLAILGMCGLMFLAMQSGIQ